MVIESGNSAKSDEVMNAFGMQFKNYSNLLWDADLKGFDSGLTTEFKNLFYKTDRLDQSTDKTNSDYPDSYQYDFIWGGFNTMDDFEDGTIDPNIWSTDSSAGGSVTESSGFLTMSASETVSDEDASATADQLNAIDFNQNSTILLQISYNVGGNSQNGVGRIKLVDESSNEVTLKTFNFATFGSSVDGEMRLEISPGTDNVAVFGPGSSVGNIQGSSGGTNVSVSSLVNGDKWNLKFEADQPNGTGSNNVSLSIGFVRYLENSAQTSAWISIADTSSSTITNAILVVSDDQTNGNIDYYLSADNGSNYEAVTPNEIHRFTNTGTQLKIKADITGGADNFSIIHHFAVAYNWY